MVRCQKTNNTVKILNAIKYTLFAIPKERASELPDKRIKITEDYFADKQKALEEKAVRPEKQARKLREQARR